MTKEEINKLCAGLEINILSAQRKGEPLKPIIEGFARAVASKARREAVAVLALPASVDRATAAFRAFGSSLTEQTEGAEDVKV